MMCLFLVFNSVNCDPTRITFTMDELLNIRDTTPSDLCPNFLASSVDLVDLLIKGAVFLGHAATLKRRRRGKRSGALVRFRERGLLIL